MIIYDVNLIRGMILGTIGLPFPMPITDKTSVIVNHDFPNTLPSNPDKYSLKGSFQSPLYKMSALGVPMFLPATLDGVELENPIITITGRKKIVETEMTGFDGSVKEIINLQDYAIKINCTLVAEPGSIWVEQPIIELKELYKKNKALTLRCALTDLFLQPKNNVVITGFNLPDMQGIENAQVVELDMLSDKYFELEIK